MEKNINDNSDIHSKFINTPLGHFMFAEDSLKLKSELMIFCSALLIKDVVSLIHSYIITSEYELNIGSKLDVLDRMGYWYTAKVVGLYKKSCYLNTIEWHDDKNWYASNLHFSSPPSY